MAGFFEILRSHLRRHSKRSRNAVLFALAATACVASNPAASQTAPNWVSLFNAWDAKYGTKDMNSQDGNVLAWSESETLDSYLYMYLATGSTSYLTEATQHIDAIWATAATNNDNVGWAWTSTASSVEKLNNGSFAVADASDATLPAGWVRGVGTTSSNAYLTGGTGPGVTLVAPSSGSATLTQSFNNYMIRPALKTKYELSLQANGKGIIQVLIAGTVAKSMTFAYTAWTPVAVDFFAPATAGENITISLSSTSKKSEAGSVASFASAAVNARLEYVDQDGMILHAITHFIRIVNDNQPALSAFSGKAQTYLTNITKHHFDTRWKNEWVTQGNQGFFIFPLDWSEERATPGDGPGTSQPYNEYQEYGRFMMELYRVTGEKAYLNKAIDMGNTLKAAMKPNGQGYVWHYFGIYTPQDAGRTPKIEDAAHANFDISFIADLYELDNSLSKADQVFTLTDIEALDYTFMNDIYDQPSSTLHRFVNGTGGLNVSPWNHSYANWPQISAVDPNILTAVTALFENPNVTTKGDDYYPLDMAKMAYYSSLQGG